MFDENREQDDKTEERSKLLAQVYELAKREEEYQDGEIGLFLSSSSSMQSLTD